MNAITRRISAPRSAGGAIDVRLYDDLDAVARDSAGGLDRAAQASLYDRIDWLRLTQAHILPDAPIVAVAGAGENRCWLFVRPTGRRGAQAYVSWYTLAFRPVFVGDPAMHAPLLTAAARALRRRFDGLTLAPLPSDAADLTQRAFAAAGWRTMRSEATANWVAHTAGQDFAAYWAKRPSRLRNTVRRKVRAADLAIKILDRFDADAWRAYEAVYIASWKPAEGSPAFLRAFAEQEGAAGTLRLGIARRNGDPVACQFWTVERGVATIHKLAHLETERASSPGTVLSEAMFRHVIDRDRPMTIDFGTGDDPYKADWMDERRMLYRLTCHDRGSIGGLARTARAALARRLRRG
jgi:hypothetical protein